MALLVWQPVKNSVPARHCLEQRLHGLKRREIVEWLGVALKAGHIVLASFFTRVVFAKKVTRFTLISEHSI